MLNDCIEIMACKVMDVNPSINGLCYVVVYMHRFDACFFDMWFNVVWYKFICNMGSLLMFLNLKLVNLGAGL